MAEFKGTITCPKCKAKEEITLRENVCMSTWMCKKCNNIARAKEGCCVFCDYGDTKCPVAPHEE
jgi:hypothetical protein